MRNIFSSLALIVTLTAPSGANAILDGSGRVKPAGKPSLFYETCEYKGHRLDLLCDETKSQPRCTVIKAYDLSGNEVPYQSLKPTPIIDMLYLENGNVCMDTKTNKTEDEFIGV